jgi:hypothetical protein
MGLNYNQSDIKKALKWEIGVRELIFSGFKQIGCYNLVAWFHRDSLSIASDYFFATSYFERIQVTSLISYNSNIANTLARYLLKNILINCLAAFEDRTQAELILDRRLYVNYVN